MIFGYSSLEFRPLWTAWSLDIELQYYLIAPILSKAIDFRNPLALLVLAIAIALLSSVLLGGVLVLSYLPFFLAGMLASHLKIQPSHRMARVISVTLLIILTTLLFCRPGYQVLLGGASSQQPEYLKYNPFLQIFVALYCMPLLLWSVHRKTGSLDHMFGDLSYIVYLVHSVALSLVLRNVPLVSRSQLLDTVSYHSSSFRRDSCDLLCFMGGH